MMRFAKLINELDKDVYGWELLTCSNILTGNYELSTYRQLLSRHAAKYPKRNSRTYFSHSVIILALLINMKNE